MKTSRRTSCSAPGVGRKRSSRAAGGLRQSLCIATVGRRATGAGLARFIAHPWRVCVGHFATQRALHLPRVGRGRRARPRFDVCRGGSRAVRFARAPLRD